METTRRDRERGRRFLIEPLCVVDDAHHRDVDREVRQRRQGGEADHERIRRPVFEPERRSQRASLRDRKTGLGVDVMPQQAVQRRVGEVHLRLDADEVDHLQVRRSLDEVLEQRGLADPRATPEHERLAHPATHRLDDASSCSRSQ